RRPARNAVVCGIHGGGHAVRQRSGTRLSPEEAGRLSGLARRIKRDGRVDLANLPTIAPWLQERAHILRRQQNQLDLREDVIQLTALRDLLLSGQLDIEPGDLVRALAMLTQVKANALKTRFLLETPNMVTEQRFKEVTVTLIELLR